MLSVGIDMKTCIADIGITRFFLYSCKAKKTALHKVKRNWVQGHAPTK